MTLTLAAGLFAAASAAAYAQAPAGSISQNQAPPSQQRQSSTATQPNAEQHDGEHTLTGCLTAAENIYTLTVMDDAGAPGTTATTTAYTLLPGTGVDLKAFVDKRVIVKGAEAEPDMQNSTRVLRRTQPEPAATGTSGSTAAGNAAGANSGSANAGSADTNAANDKAGGARPTVQTESKARINAKTLNVRDVQPASGSCGAH